MDRSDTIIVFLSSLVMTGWFVMYLLAQIHSTLRAVLRLLIENSTRGAPDKSPAADPAHPRDQSLG